MLLHQVNWLGKGLGDNWVQKSLRAQSELPPWANTRHLCQPNITSSDTGVQTGKGAVGTGTVGPTLTATSAGAGSRPRCTVHEPTTHEQLN